MNLFNELKTFLSGKKTYLMAFALFAYCVGGYFTGHLDAQTALGLLFSSGTIASLRAAIDKAIPPAPGA
jgi:hypothetical protein